MKFDESKHPRDSDGFEYGVISNSSQTIQYAKHYPITDSAFLLQKKE